LWRKLEIQAELANSGGKCGLWIEMWRIVAEMSKVLDSGLNVTKKRAHAIQRNIKRRRRI